MFTATMLYDDTYVIRGEGCDAYLLTGAEKAIMIDAGMSTHNIRQFAEETCGRPVDSVINTHSHFDHTASNGFFDKVYVTAGISRSAKNTFGADPSRYPLDYNFTLVKDGGCLNLGRRELRIIELNAHSPGNIAVLDMKRRALFPGDEIDAGQVLLLPGYAEKPGQIHAAPAASVETYWRAMQKLKGMEAYFDNIFPAHNGAPLGKEWLDRFIALAQRILDGYEGNRDCSGRGYRDGMGHFPLLEANYRRGEWEGAALVYCADLILDKDYEKGQVEPATLLHKISSTSVYGN